MNAPVPRDRSAVTRRLVVGAASAAVVASAVAALLVGGREHGSAVSSVDRAATPMSTEPAPPAGTDVASPAPDSSVEPSTTRATTDAAPSTTVSTTTTSGPPATAPPQDDDDPAVVARPVPVEPPPPPPSAPPPPWAASTSVTSAGLVSTDVGCADDVGAGALDRFFAERVGPVLGWDYQHVVALGGNRFLWLFQDAFVDHSGTASTLDAAGFAHNVAMVQDGRCFRLLHRGTTGRPQPFEPGTGTATLSTWFWPMGGEVHGDRLHVVWAQMTKDAVDPVPPDGLGWHPTATWIGTYDVATLARVDFRPAPNAGVTPIYGYAMVSDATHTYLFGNTFEQNLSREGGYWNGPHSATRVYLARVPLGQVFTAPEYRTADGWSTDPAAAQWILSRHWAEFPFQPRLIDGQWVGVAAVDSYWDDAYSVDVANEPWGPWTTVEFRRILPRNGDPRSNTYHAHLLPWRDGAGQLVVTISNNARNMLRDAWPFPGRYRPVVFTSPWADAPPPPTTIPPSTVPPTTIPPSTVPPTTIPPSTVPPTTVPPSTVPPTSSTTAPSTTSVPSTTEPPSGTTTTAVTTTTSATTTTSTGPPSVSTSTVASSTTSSTVAPI